MHHIRGPQFHETNNKRQKDNMSPDIIQYEGPQYHTPVSV